MSRKATIALPGGITDNWRMIHGRKVNLNWQRGRMQPEREEVNPQYRLLLTPAVSPLTGFAPAWDQGQEGSCTGHGVGAMVMFEIHLLTGQFFMPSRQWIYYQERKKEHDVKQDAGAIVSDGVSVIEKLGVPAEALWPYTKKFSTAPSKAVNQAALAWANKFKGLSLPASVDALKQVICGNCPVVGGFDVYSSFESQVVALSGIMPVPKNGEQLLGGHCVLWDGYDDNFEANGHKGYFWCRNSWGTQWGRKGWFMMPYDNIKYCSDFHILNAK